MFSCFSFLNFVSFFLLFHFFISLPPPFVLFSLVFRSLSVYLNPPFWAPEMDSPQSIKSKMKEVLGPFVSRFRSPVSPLSHCFICYLNHVFVDVFSLFFILFFFLGMFHVFSILFFPVPFHFLQVSGPPGGLRAGRLQPPTDSAASLRAPALPPQLQ